MLDIAWEKKWRPEKKVTSGFFKLRIEESYWPGRHVLSECWITLL